MGLPEHLRPDPFGGIVEADRVTGAAPAHQIVLESGRAAYASCHLIAILPEGGARAACRPTCTASGFTF